MDLRGDFVKLFNILPKYLTTYNYAALSLNEAPKEIEQCTLEFQTLWDKETKENRTNKAYLIYCDWNPLLFYKEETSIHYF